MEIVSKFVYSRLLTLTWQFQIGKELTDGFVLQQSFTMYYVARNAKAPTRSDKRISNFTGSSNHD